MRLQNLSDGIQVLGASQGPAARTPVSERIDTMFDQVLLECSPIYPLAFRSRRSRRSRTSRSYTVLC